ncbi:MAG: chemotaxis protein CheB [Bacteroidales bacterium]|jgi:two-component system chemotaxis response regulator CheB|nr:chemotaxis protein CheB [Bacteroidales bacterium]HNT40606.1 chemotaxis protein CheB [Tenuifilaceae bacterium]MBP8642861.1 chemotaxis protein CheB [Bacteroidales bacterium]HOA09175.1 chemotaxis protein CheB [Tenuifilaceae bacterium]HOC35626.1 chemotaxis protein CheB [Tenuifilaceae bacterium]
MYKAVIIGGSAGSFQVITRILHSLPASFPLPVLLCLHRLKHVRSGFVEALSLKSGIPIIEPDDKEQIKPGKAYLAPANYHMFIELGNKIALSTEDPVNHSRPSIDLSFLTAAQVYRDKLIGVILSGANRDGAYGLKKIKDLGGLAIVQDPNECQVRTMTEASLKMTPVDHVYNTSEIIRFLQTIKT